MSAWSGVDVATGRDEGASKPESSLPMYLIMVNGGIPGAMLRLTAEGTRLGRAVDNTYPLPEGSVSRHHALFTVDPQGVVRLSDLASINGTFRGSPIHNPNRFIVVLSDHDNDRVNGRFNIMVMC